MGSNGNFNSIKSDDPNIINKCVDDDDSKVRIYSQSERIKKIAGVDGISKNGSDSIKYTLTGSSKKNGSSHSNLSSNEIIYK